MRILILVFASILVAISGCENAKTARPVSAANREAITTLASAYTADLAVLKTVVDATLRADDILARGAAHNEFFLKEYVVAGTFEPDVDTFDRDLADASKSSMLVEEVRLGRMSREEAVVFLRDYSAVCRTSRDLGFRDAMLDRFAPFERSAAAREALLGAIDEGAALRLRLVKEIAENNDVLIFAADATSNPLVPLFSEQSLPVWESALFASITDPAVRAAAMDLWRKIGQGLSQ